MDRVIYRCKTKATDREGDLIRCSVNWLFARRGELRLTERAIECGDWRIPYEEIDDTVLLSIPMVWGTAYNLKIQSQGKTYQFQLKSISYWRSVIDAYWFGETPLPLRDEVADFDWRASQPQLRIVFLWTYLILMAPLLLVIFLLRVMNAL
jgi:hypothetical protein